MDKVAWGILRFRAYRWVWVEEGVFPKIVESILDHGEYKCERNFFVKDLEAILQYSTVQYSTVQYDTVLFEAALPTLGTQLPDVSVPIGGWLNRCLRFLST